MAHTPGPWTVDTDRTILCARTDFSTTIGTSIAAIYSWMGVAEADANAALISAAPDLLAALKETLGTLRLLTGQSDARFEANWRNALDAIKKAEGR